MRSITVLLITSLCLSMLGLSGCSLFAGGRAIVVSTPSACSSLLPADWLNGVDSADLGDGGALLSDWIKFADAQTGQLDKSNDRYKAAVGIVSRCEERDRAALKKVK